MRLNKALSRQCLCMTLMGSTVVQVINTQQSMIFPGLFKVKTNQSSIDLLSNIFNEECCHRIEIECKIHLHWICLIAWINFILFCLLKFHFSCRIYWVMIPFWWIQLLLQNKSECIKFVWHVIYNTFKMYWKFNLSISNIGMQNICIPFHITVHYCFRATHSTDIDVRLIYGN